MEPIYIGFHVVKKVGKVGNNRTFGRTKSWFEYRPVSRSNKGANSSKKLKLTLWLMEQRLQKTLTVNGGNIVKDATKAGDDSDSDVEDVYDESTHMASSSYWASGSGGANWAIVMQAISNLNGEAAESFRGKVLERLSTQLEDMTSRDADQVWNTLAGIIKDAAKDCLGVASGATRTQQLSRESWWFSKEVQAKVTVKQSRFRELLLCREGHQADITAAVERYKVAKREAKKAVAQAKDKVYEDLYKRLDSKEGANDIFRIAKA
ncbi:hypothetical protein CTI12_AA244270 [Artemisia annua]|uniref:Uncharacterized protein n=1 Tax=Artemisia annua TaxID=35608 RepID=A0A2U1NNP5_ARTAN|nr:hypothetical protein CTI12_AA244270 [Artemisia annua]